MRLGGRVSALLALVGLAAFAAPAAAQDQARITGVVKGSEGFALSPATVRIEALALSANTRSDGSFVIVVPKDRSLGQRVSITARYVGHAAVTKSIELKPGEVFVDFVLSANPFEIGELVTTGGGTEAEFEKLGVERKSLDSLTIRNAGEKNVVQALAGKLPGVVVQQQSGEVGSSARIQIRGVRTLTQGNTQPLIVIDGVVSNNSTNITGSAVSSTASPNRLADLNPDDIESIEVLSGASSAAVYGSLAGNGVILITTKRGRSGTTNYSFRSNVQVDEAFQGVPTQRRFGVGTGGATPTCVPGGPASCALTAGFFSWGGAVPAGQATFDWSREIFGQGTSFDNTFQVSGGSERTSFFLSAGSTRQQGFVVGDQDFFNRTTIRANASHQMTNALKIGANIGYATSSQNAIGRGNNTNGLLLGALRTPANFNNFEPTAGLRQDAFGVTQSSWRFPNPTSGDVAANRFFDNPVWAIYNNPANQGADRIFGNLNLDWTPFSFLSVKYNLGGDFSAEDRLEARAQQASGTPRGGSLTRWQFNENIIDHQLNATAKWTMSENFAGSFQVGQQLYQRTFRQVFATGQTLITPQPFRLGNVATTPPSDDGEQMVRLEGYFAQAKFDIGKQLYLIGTIRNDGASTFGINNQRAWYPQASMAWNFRQGGAGGLLSYGKLRAAYGQSGQIPGAYQLQNFFLGGGNGNLADFNPGSSLNPAIGAIAGVRLAANRGNPNLRPERNEEISVGTDFAMLNDRVDLALTYYQINSSDVILGLARPATTGFTSVTTNSARIRNRGIEASINVRPIRTKDFSWEVGFNFARNRNRVLQLSADPADSGLRVVGFGPSFAGRSTNATVDTVDVYGQPLRGTISVIRGTDFARCGRGLTGAIPGQAAGVTYESVCAGAANNALIVGANGLPIADGTERTIGDPNADWTGGLRSTFSIRKFTISGFLDIRQGGSIQNMTRASMYQYGTHGDTDGGGDVNNATTPAAIQAARGITRTFGQNGFFTTLPNGQPAPAPVGPGAGTSVVLGEAWFGGNGGIGGPAAQFQEDGSFVRLREVSIAYLWDSRWLQRSIGLSSVEFRAAGRNLWLSTNYTGFDPETNLGGGAVGNTGFDWFVYPVAKSFIFSVALNR
ncbi:MAG: SusC/RagA family TonB-linked outer membrane protein [Gemmatimonadales bacterium]|nr:SusC/RagA family TonB-linked outer membrane protein [Gemmatimonadales bacterium]